MNYFFPRYFVPLYSMIAFSTIPYDEAVKTVEKREQTIRKVLSFTAIAAASAGVAAVVGSVVWVRYFGEGNKVNRF